MRHTFLARRGLAAIAMLFAAFISTVGISAQSQSAAKTYDCIAYVWSGGQPLPPADMVTAINYAFAYPNKSLTGIDIANERRFRDVVNLKQQNPNLKVLISMGGDCSKGYSKMVACDSLRQAFARDCRRVIDEYGIDGIDMDWEFPAGAGGQPEDIENFISLLADIRREIGDEHMLTVAAGFTGAGLRLRDALNYIDYINVMSYDMGWQAPYHHTSLYRSKLSGVSTVDETIDFFVGQGVPLDRLVLGLAFYGRGDGGVHFTDWTLYREIELTEGLQRLWDPVACVPYIADSEGNLVLGFEDAKSLAIKCDYIKKRGLRGGMYWRTEGDTDDWELTRTVARCLMGKE